MNPNATPSHARGSANRAWHSPVVRHRLIDGWRPRAEVGRGRAGRITVGDLLPPAATTPSRVASARAAVDHHATGGWLDSSTAANAVVEAVREAVHPREVPHVDVHLTEGHEIESAVIPASHPKSVAVHIGADILTVVPHLDAAGNLRIAPRWRRTVTLTWDTDELATVDAERILGSITRRLAHNQPVASDPRQANA